MKLKGLFFLMLGAAVVFGAWQYWQYQKGNGLSCGGDWSHRMTCSVGSYCRSLDQGPLAGGTCQPYLSSFFDQIFVNLKSSKPPSSRGGRGESLSPPCPADILCAVGYRSCLAEDGCQLKCCPGEEGAGPSDKSSVGSFCGGFAGKSCPSGYKCQLDGNYPDASGKCVRN